MEKIHYSRYELFAFAWVYAGVIHFLSRQDYNFWLLIPALLFFLFPRKQFIFWTFIGIQTWQILSKLPIVPNHQILTLFVNFALITNIKKRPDFTVKTIPYFRTLLLGVYLFAFFHKLNLDFFNPDLGCTTFQYKKMLESPLGTFLPSLSIVSSYGSYFILLIEAVIVVLISLNSALVLFFGFIIHGLLSFAKFYDFAAVVFATYLLIFPKWPEKMNKSSLVAWKVMVGLSLVAELMNTLLIQQNIRFTQLQFLSPVLFLIGFFVLFAELFRSTKRFPLHQQNRMSKIQIVFLVVFFFNLVTPYLGIKTVSNFSMFSNLRVEQGSNHFLIGDQLKISKNADDVAWIIEAPPQWQLPSQEGIPFKEIQRIITDLRVTNHPPLSVRFERDGKMYDVRNAIEDHETIPSLSFLERKLLGFRLVSREGINECRW